MDEATRVVNELIETVWNGHDLARLDQFFADPFEHHGREDTVSGLRRWHEADEATWADTRFDVLQMISDGSTVAVRWRATARHIGPWGPVEATGREVTWEGAHFITVAAGRITAMWALGDRFAKAQQLDALV